MKTSKTALRPGCVGVDISKEMLDVSLAGKSPQQYENNPAGIAGLLKTLPSDVHVICEPSGGYLLFKNSEAFSVPLW